MGSLTHEIVTLQFGHYANYVGSHWWNTQEASFVYDPKQNAEPKDINHDVMFREGQNLMGDVTYTPRLVLFDLKGSLNTLRQEGRLYEIPEEGDDVLNWNCDVTMHKSASLPKNDFLKDLEKEEQTRLGKPYQPSQDESADDNEMDQDASESPQKEELPIFGKKLYDLDDSIRSWSDYLSIHLHPKTINVVEQYTHESESSPFELYGQGYNVYKDDRTRREIEDRIHFFLEESDHLQGIQILTDIHNGFGGLSSAVLQELEDELDSKSIMVYGVSPPQYAHKNPIQDSYRLMSMALTFEKLANHSSAFVPLSLIPSYGRKPGPSVLLPNLQYKTELPYHTAAILAASMDTVTLPYRLEVSPSYMSYLTQAMAQGSRKVLGLCSSLPFAMKENSTLTDSLLQLGDTLPWQPLTPGLHGNMSCISQSLVVRGIPFNKLKGKLDPERSRVLDRCSNLQDLMSVYLMEMCDCSRNAICGVRTPTKVTAPFPHIFSPHVSKDGYITPHVRPKETGVEQIPMMTSLQSTSAIYNTIKPLLDDVRKIDLRRHIKILDDCLEEDDYKESLNNLKTLLDNYDEGYQDIL